MKTSKRRKSAYHSHASAKIDKEKIAKQNKKLKIKNNLKQEHTLRELSGRK